MRVVINKPQKTLEKTPRLKYIEIESLPLQKDHNLLDVHFENESKFDVIVMVIRNKDRHGWVLDYLSGNGFEVMTNEEVRGYEKIDRKELEKDKIMSMKWPALRAYAKKMNIHSGRKTRDEIEAEVFEKLGL